MRDGERSAALLLARLPAHRRQVERAREVVRRTLEQHAPAYVAYSGGKDSTVLLHLARTVAPTIEARILLWPESHLLGNFDEVVDRWRALGATIHAVRQTRASFRERSPDKWRYLDAIGPIRSVLIGLRARESSIRRMSLRRFGVAHRRSDGIVRVCPLAGWSTMDVAAVIAAHDLPLIDAYEATIDVRTTTRIIARPGLTEKALAQMRETRPDAMAHLREIYPEDF